MSASLLDYTGTGGRSWLEDMQPASWRGVPFKVIDSAVNRGRRTAVHEYPYRDTVWVEDLGRNVRKLAFRGFLIGDDVADQQDDMLAAAEQAGPGELVHPTLGSISVNLVEFSAGQRRELGRVVELEFSFVETGLLLFPTGAASTQDAVNAAADETDAAAQGDFFDRVGASVGSGVAAARGVLQQGASVVQSVVGAARGFEATVNTAMSDASRAVNAVRGLGGIVGANLSLGRYAGGSLLSTVPRGVSNAIAGVASIGARVDAASSALISGSAQGVATVRNAAATVLNLAGQL